MLVHRNWKNMPIIEEGRIKLNPSDEKVARNQIVLAILKNSFSDRKRKQSIYRIQSSRLFLLL